MQADRAIPAADETRIEDPRRRSNGEGTLPLSPRETEVLELASHGMTNAEIARRLRLSVHAVKFHLASIYRKLRVMNRTEAAFAYLQALSQQASNGREPH
jgi:DNA-binding CsgD family transcriptional regulator